MIIPTTRPYFKEDDIQAICNDVHEILKSGRLILGPYTEDFETRFRKYCGVRHAIAVSSCTAALEIVLRYYDVKDKEVIVSTNTFIASSNAVIYSGGIPILADINSETLCLGKNDLLKQITSKTTGVILTHLAGLITPELEEIKEICKKKDLFLIEDAAHAHGAMINGKKAGSLGDAGCFSFYPTKVMTTCIGGMITTQDDALADYAVSLRHHGVGKDLNNIVNLGNDWLMSEITALLGIYQLKALEENIARRNEIAQRYANSLADIEGISLFQVPSHIRHSYYKYPIKLSENINRDELIAAMKHKHDINLGSSYDPPCHLHPVYQRLFRFRTGMFPVSDEILKQVAALPMFVQMNNEEVDYVVESLKEEIKKYKQRRR